MKRKMIFILILVFSILLITCISIPTEKNNIYELESVPSNYERGFWESSLGNAYQRLDINNNIEDNKTRTFSFDIIQNGKIDIGQQFMDDERIILYTEPFDLKMFFFIEYGNEYGNIQKIIVNKMIFRTKNKVIDLRENSNVYYISSIPVYPSSYKYIPEDELTDFRTSGTIEIMNINVKNGNLIERHKKIEIGFIYNNIDIIFRKDRYFSVEYDISIESDIEGYEIENYSFLAKFVRKRFTDKYNLLGAIIFGWAYSR
jgi:hypothetical protein